MGNKNDCGFGGLFGDNFIWIILIGILIFVLFSNDDCCEKKHDCCC